MSGAGDVQSPGNKAVGKNFSGQLNSLLGSAQPLYNTEAQFKPQYAALDFNNLASIMPQFASLLQNTAPTAAGTVRGINPGQTSLLSSLTGQAQQGLDEGANIDPALARVFSQSARAGQAARGLGYGPSDVLGESMALTNLGESLRTQRQNFATTVAGANNEYDVQPTLNLLTNTAGGASGLASNAGPTLYNSGQAGNLLSSIYGERSANNRATAANNTGLFQSMDSNLTSGISSTQSSY